MQISLAAARINKGLTQAEVAAALGKHVNTVTNWENGKTRIKAKDFERLCNLYRCEAADISLPRS